MVPGLDSSYQRPTRADAYGALASGVRLWCGYIRTREDVGLATGWTRDDFDAARVCGGKPIAFCSGWDDPVLLRQIAAQWDVRLCLDMEAAIRSKGAWTQPWLDASDAGLYALFPDHAGLRAQFHIGARYPGFDPEETWYGAPPQAPHGWQWEGTHSERGISVDRGWYDDWFLSTVPVRYPPVGPTAQFRLEDMPMPLTVRRGDGTRDVFAVMPDGSMRHVAIGPDGNILSDDLLPGSWSAIISAEWTSDEKQLSVEAFGWQNGQGGTVFKCYWTQDESYWHGPALLI